jgi:heme-degrading monooxygenase HmoA
VNETAKTPEPPYHVVIFTSRRTPGDNGYGERSERMMELAKQQPGYLGMESVRGADGFGITLSYWESAEAIAAWSKQQEHAPTKAHGIKHWYEEYVMRHGVVEREKRFEKP